MVDITGAGSSVYAFCKCCSQLSLPSISALATTTSPLLTLLRRSQLGMLLIPLPWLPGVVPVGAPPAGTSPRRDETRVVGVSRRVGWSKIEGVI